MMVKRAPFQRHHRMLVGSFTVPPLFVFVGKVRRIPFSVVPPVELIKALEGAISYIRRP